MEFLPVEQYRRGELGTRLGVGECDVDMLIVEWNCLKSAFYLVFMVTCSNFNKRIESIIRFKGKREYTSLFLRDSG